MHADTCGNIPMNTIFKKDIMIHVDKDLEKINLHLKKKNSSQIYIKGEQV
jgi:hypothetical protein